MKERLKNYNIPILVLALLVLIGGFGYIVYDYSNLFVNNQNAVVEDTKPEIKDEKKEEYIKEPDHTLINGSWKTEILEDGRFLEFTINYPEVTNFDGTKGTVEYDAESKGYIVTIKHETGVDTVFLISDFDDNTGTVYYYENGSEELNTLAMNRDPETAPDNVLANTTEQKPEANQNTASNNKPSSSANNNKPSASTGNAKPPASNSGNSSNNPKGHYEERQVCVQEAYDEQVLVKKGECTNVLVKDAWDEQVADYSNAYFNGDPVEVVVCNQCGAVVYGNFFEVHGNEEHRGWHNEVRDTCEPYWHNVTYKTVHHDAVYETQCEPDEYKTVHHDAVYETQMVWVED